ncbi:hypothetical protein PG997_012491 [Apiospora hydei]|uniref:DUF397 domain-containing protein n=1 Tax=Apiospora hydei TaxID=1337664 RepID=A0ABR1V3H7_9PEZI
MTGLDLACDCMAPLCIQPDLFARCDVTSRVGEMETDAMGFAMEGKEEEGEAARALLWATGPRGRNVTEKE